nr:MAG TPA: hypothetical protein [Caudoviricetes sp.]
MLMSDNSINGDYDRVRSAKPLCKRCFVSTMLSGTL